MYGSKEHLRKPKDAVGMTPKKLQAGGPCIFNAEKSEPETRVGQHSFAFSMQRSSQMILNQVDCMKVNKRLDIASDTLSLHSLEAHHVNDLPSQLLNLQPATTLLDTPTHQTTS